METKAEESIVVGREKKAPSSNSHIITSTKRTTKPSQTTTSSTNKATSTPSEKNIPNYLKPTRSSHLESPSFKQPKSTDAPNNKPNINRRRSFDRPLSSSNLTKQNQPSPSRLHKALVSPGPRERIIPNRPSTTVPVKSTKPSKPISDRRTKNPREGKTKLLYVKKSTPSLYTSKVANDHASVNSTNAAKNNAGTTEGSKVETKEVKEVTEQEVEIKKLENEENYQVEHVSEISPHVDSEHDEHEHDHDHGLEESDQPHNQANDEKVISTVSEEELKKETQEEKTKDEHDEEEENTNHDDSNNNGSHPEEKSLAEEEQEEELVVNEKEDHVGGVIIEDHSSENNNEEEAVVEEKEEIERGTSEGVVEEAKVEATPLKQLQGKKLSQVSNDVIEETASKLQLEARKNKVRALAGAFQTVIDYQTTSK